MTLIIASNVTLKILQISGYWYNRGIFKLIIPFENSFLSFDRNLEDFQEFSPLGYVGYVKRPHKQAGVLKVLDKRILSARKVVFCCN
ncbi:hypothetical protein PUN28_008287 [Cardiocondyla obscurior]|uniref:Uncharacterized protein n=1 Tax=Cardiocondyla obscurior TaxID=286306 RepID=A0AAW2FZZ7_9HYME